eukprot:2059891-Prymnesium_polylepis.1
MAHVVTFAIVFAGTVESFDAAARTSYINALAASANVAPSSITIVVSAASVEIAATIVTANAAQASS